jgi:hypothetical protein
MGQDQGQAQVGVLSARRGADVEYKPRERVRGFLNYVMQVYPSMIPYLRGFHGRLDSWRPNFTADSFDKQLNVEREEDQGVKRPPRKQRKLLSPTSTGVVEEEDDLIKSQFYLSNYLDHKFGLQDDDDLDEEEQLD